MWLAWLPEMTFLTQRGVMKRQRFAAVLRLCYNPAHGNRGQVHRP